MALNKSENAVLGYVHRDGYFTTDPGRGKRMNNAAYSLVRKGICKIVLRGTAWDEDRHQVGGGYTETTRRQFSTIRVTING